MDAQEIPRHLIDKDSLPELFPTDHLPARFWEHLGRTVGTFGFLEEVLKRAIFALTGTRPYEAVEAEATYPEWIKRLERTLSDPLGSLVDTYAKAARNHPDFSTANFDELVDSLRMAASGYRNVVCHASWGPPDAEGKSLPFYVNRQGKVFDTRIDVEFLLELQSCASELACEVMNTIWHMGLQFPGSDGPGKPIWVK